MLFIYAIDRHELLGIITRHNFIGKQFDMVSEDTVQRFYGYEKPIVVHNGCTYPSPEFAKIVDGRNGLLLPLVCGHVAHP